MEIIKSSVKTESKLINEMTGSSPVDSLAAEKTPNGSDIPQVWPRALSFTFNNEKDFSSYGRLKAEILELKNSLAKPDAYLKQGRPIERMIKFAMYKWQYVRVGDYAEPFWEKAYANGIGPCEEVYFEPGCCFYSLPTDYQETDGLIQNFVKSQNENLIDIKMTFPVLNNFEMVNIVGDDNCYFFAEYKGDFECFPALIIISPDNIVRLYLIDACRFFDLCCSILENTPLLQVILRDIS